MINETYTYNSTPFGTRLPRVPNLPVGMTPYVAGLTEEAVLRQYNPPRIIKLASNESPFLPSQAVIDAIRDASCRINRYPDCDGIINSISAVHSVCNSNILVGAGSTDLIASVVRALTPESGEIIISKFGYSAYMNLILEARARPIIAESGPNFSHSVDNILGSVTPATKLVLIDTPSNLSGAVISANSIDYLLSNLPASVNVLLDMAYADFSDVEIKTYIRDPRVIIARTFSKAYALAGLRIGYLIIDAELASVVLAYRPPFPISNIGSAAAITALSENSLTRERVGKIVSTRSVIEDRLESLGLKVIRGKGNFTLVEVGDRSKEIYDYLLSNGIIVRIPTAYGLNRYFRISVGTDEEIETFMKIFEMVINKTPNVNIRPDSEVIGKFPL